MNRRSSQGEEHQFRPRPVTASTLFVKAQEPADQRTQPRRPTHTTTRQNLDKRPITGCRGAGCVHCPCRLCASAQSAPPDRRPRAGLLGRATVAVTLAVGKRRRSGRDCSGVRRWWWWRWRRWWWRWWRWRWWRWRENDEGLRPRRRSEPSGGTISRGLLVRSRHRRNGSCRH